MKIGCIFFVFFLFFSHAVFSQTKEDLSPSEMFLNARNSFEYGNYTEAIQLFKKLLYPSPGRLQQEVQKKNAYKYLGLSYFYASAKEKKFLLLAKEELLNYLYLEPQAELDPALYPPGLIRFFRTLKKQHQKKLEAILQKRQSQKPALPIQLIPIGIEKRKLQIHPLLIALPFGVPQYAYGQTTKATLFLVGESLLLGLNLSSYFWISKLQISEGEQRGRFLASDVSLAKGLQIVQFTSFGLFCALVLYGWIDAGLTFGKYKEKQTYLPYQPVFPISPRQFLASFRKKTIFSLQEEIP